MRINSINQNTNQHPSFGINVSPKVKAYIEKQSCYYNFSKIQKKEIYEKFNNIENWNPQTVKLTIAQNKCGNLALAIRKRASQYSSVLWPIEHLNARTVLSQFLNLTEKHITEQNTQLIICMKNTELEYSKDLKYSCS